MLSALAIAGVMVPGLTLEQALLKWDAGWYLVVTERFYPADVAAQIGPPDQNTIPFFPLFPLLIRAAHELGVPMDMAAIGLAHGLAALAAALLWRLAHRFGGVPVADWSVALFCFAPGAYVLSMAYSEPLMFALAIACLLALLDRRWWRAGLLAGFASATRLSAIVLAACCLWAALEAWRQGRDRSAFVAPLLAPAGLCAYFGYLWLHTGDPLAYLHVRRVGWGEEIDFGLSSLRLFGRLLSEPLTYNVLVPALGLVAAIVMGWLFWRWRPPAVLAIYTVGVCALALSSGAVAMRPRMLLTAFPLLIGLARGLTPLTLGIVLAASASAMTMLGMLTVTSLALTP